MAASVRDRLTSRLAHLVFLLTRPVTLGVRGVVIGEDDSILLVRHGYVSGWHFPGGGVEPGESCAEALARELEEEASVALDGPPLLHGVFFNAHASRRDHVAVFVARAFSVRGERVANREIKDGGDKRGRPRAAGGDFPSRAASGPLVNFRGAQVDRPPHSHPIALILTGNIGGECLPLTPG